MRTENSEVSARVFEAIVRRRGRECPRCGGRHRDTVYKMCSVCRDLTAAYHKAYRHDHIARKLCPECVQAKGRVTKTCETHRKYNNAFLQKVRDEQHEKGLCRWGRCSETAEGWYCDKHTAKCAEYYAKRVRRARRTGVRWAA